MLDNYKLNNRVRVACPRCHKSGTPSIRWIKNRDKSYHNVSQYYHLYVGHYDASKYQEQLLRYKSRARKSRPNGRRWCYLRPTIDYRVRMLYPDLWLLIHDPVRRRFKKATTLEEPEEPWEWID